jgi:predicted transcriptional regulator
MRLEFDMTNEHIASETGSTPDAVRMAIRRAAKVLADMLADVP